MYINCTKKYIIFARRMIRNANNVGNIDNSGCQFEKRTHCVRVTSVLLQLRVSFFLLFLSVTIQNNTENNKTPGRDREKNFWQLRDPTAINTEETVLCRYFMSTTADTAAIDEKKDQTNGKSSASISEALKTYVTHIAIIIAAILVYFAWGGAILYLCKIGQANILPTNVDCTPYTNAQTTIQDITTNIFPTSTSSGPNSHKVSWKLSFPQSEENMSYSLLHMMKEYKYRADSHFMGNYFVSVLERIFSYNYASLTGTANIVNQWSEPCIVLFGPVFFSLWFALNLLVNQLYLVYVWFSSMQWFFKRNATATEAAAATSAAATATPEWTSPSTSGYAIGVLLSVVFTILFFIGYPILSCLPVGCAVWSIFSALMLRGFLQGAQASVGTVIKDTLVFYKRCIMICISIFVTTSAFTTLGAAEGGFSLLALAIMYYMFGIFSASTPINATPEVGYKQATRGICAPSGGEQQGWLSWLLGRQVASRSQQRGGGSGRARRGKPGDIIDDLLHINTY